MDKERTTINISLAAVPTQRIQGGPGAEARMEPGKVMMHFPTPMQNVSFSPVEARLMAKKLTDLAVEAEKIIDKQEKKPCGHCGQPLESHPEMPNGNGGPEASGDGKP